MLTGSMLDYFFCEQCQTYHHPNRLINGQLLPACQCQLKTQPEEEKIQYKPLESRPTFTPESPQLQQRPIKSVSPFPITKVHREVNGFYNQKNINQMPFFNILYKNHIPPFWNKSTQISHVSYEQSGKKQPGSILSKASRFLKDIPLQSYSHLRVENESQLNESDKTVPFKKPVFLKPSKLKPSKSVKSVEEDTGKGYQSTNHKKTQKNSFNSDHQAICCDQRCFYF